MIFTQLAEYAGLCAGLGVMILVLFAASMIAMTAAMKWAGYNTDWPWKR